MSALPILSNAADPGDDPSRIVSPESVWGPRLQRLRSIFARGDQWIVCFSGGVDSAFVLAVAVAERGEDVLALTAVSETLPDEEREGCMRLAAALGARHQLVESNEMEVEGFFSNPTNRCYFCKSELYRVARRAAKDLGAQYIADGVNVNDLGDHRPGLIAADEAAIVHPLVEAEMTKADVRGASRALGLDVWDKPAFACLSSRFPYGTRITPERLDMVGTVERLLKALGFRQYRVRYHGEVVRIEVRPEDLPRLVAEPARSQVVQSCHDVGFRYVTLDLQGFRSGSMNEGLSDPS
jgi:pyridinium-3,5-biscarboxylic acid mononucleotide sulfurtransferase